MQRLSIPGAETGTETGTPVLQFSPPVAGVESRFEFTAPLVRYDKPEHPSVYFYAKGVSFDGTYVPFSDGHPGPEFVRVRPVGVVLSMGIDPTMPVFIRRDDPYAALAEVVA